MGLKIALGALGCAVATGLFVLAVRPKDKDRIVKRAKTGNQPEATTKISSVEAATLEFWRHVGGGRAKNYIGPYLKQIADRPGDYPWMAPPTAQAFREEFEKAGAKWKVHPAVIRGVQSVESGPNPWTTALTDSTTALGLAQMICETAASLGYLWPELVKWRTGIDAIAHYLHNLGWPADPSFLPTKDQAEAQWAKFKRGEPVERWFKAVCSYYTGDLKKSGPSGINRIRIANSPSLWKVDFKRWLQAPAALNVFYEARANSVKGLEVATKG